MSGPVEVRWMWAFLDVPRPVADATWGFWATVTRSTLSPRRGEEGEFSTLTPAYGDPWIKVQSVGDGGGVHLDLDVEDPQAAADTAVGLGARIVADRGYVVMRSPGGFTFCLTHPDGQGRQVRDGEPDLLDQVCLDLPAAAHDDEIAFWSSFTGWEHVDSPLAEFGYLRRPSRMPLRLLFQRLGEPEGSVRGHVDLACVDRAASRARVVDLGATVDADRDFWTVLRDPSGQAFCLTDRSPTAGWVPTG
jgi:hypothetical protein